MSEPTTDHSQRVAESAHADEVQSLETALRQSEVRLHTFESTFRQTTTEFISRYAQNEIDETLESIEWLGEARMAQHIQRRIERLFSTADGLAGNADALSEVEIVDARAEGDTK
jgi:phage shock protein A